MNKPINYILNDYVRKVYHLHKCKDIYREVYKNGLEIHIDFTISLENVNDISECFLKAQEIQRQAFLDTEAGFLTITCDGIETPAFTISYRYFCREFIKILTISINNE